MEPADPNFEILADRRTPVSGRGGRRWMVASIAAHGSLLGVLMAVSLLGPEPLPEPAALTVKAFLVEPGLAPAPPPPPPPAAARLRITPQAVATPSPVAVFQAPLETPTEVKAEPGIDLALDGGVPGGVEGGVPGGVVGGVVGGVPDALAPPTPRVVHVGGDVKEPTKVRNVNPTYPQVAVAGRVEGTVVLEATIAPSGKVADVRVLRSLPLLEKAAIDAVRQWIYTPTLIDGVPVTAIMTVTVRFQLT